MVAFFETPANEKWMTGELYAKDTGFFVPGLKFNTAFLAASEFNLDGGVADIEAAVKLLLDGFYEVNIGLYFG